ncbi:MAG: DUF6311 domain-containing protein [Pseudomonadota bacterium]
MADTTLIQDHRSSPFKVGSAVDLLIPAIIGFAWFLAFANLQLLNPTNTAWLQSADPAASFLGWRFFMESPWTFPPGLNPDFGIELSRSIVYSDAFPLLALTTKLFAPVLPEGFHLFGVWVLVIFVLQAVFASKLIGLFTTDRALIIVGTVFFVSAPVLLHRLTFPITMHFALASHFLILAMLYAFLRPATDRSSAFWLILLALSLTIHFYLFAMVGIFWWAELKRAQNSKVITAKAFNIEMASAVGMVLVLAYMVGYFAGDTAKAPDYGSFALNLFAPFDSDGWSFIVPDLAGRPGDYEGYNYLGLGVLLGLGICAVLLVSKRVHMPVVDRTKFWTIAPFIVLVPLALSHQIGVGTTVLSIPMPAFITETAGILRASGRMVWPLYYVVILGMIYVLAKGLPRAASITVLAALLAVQLADTSGMWATSANPLRAPATGTWTTPLKDPVWAEAGHRYDVVRMTKPTNAPDNWSDLAYFALQNDMSTNVVYLSRIEDDMIAASKADMNRRFASGTFEMDTLYIVDDEHVAAARANLDETKHGLRVANGFHLLTPGWPVSR